MRTQTKCTMSPCLLYVIHILWARAHLISAFKQARKQLGFLVLPPVPLLSYRGFLKNK